LAIYKQISQLSSEEWQILKEIRAGQSQPERVWSEITDRGNPHQQVNNPSRHKLEWNSARQNVSSPPSHDEEPAHIIFKFVME
jgi:hypothetical protein